MALEVDIRKKFSGFTLDVSFRSEGGCMGILGRFRLRKKHDAEMYRRD